MCFSWHCPRHAAGTAAKSRGMSPTASFTATLTLSPTRGPCRGVLRHVAACRGCTLFLFFMLPRYVPRHVAGRVTKKSNNVHPCTRRTVGEAAICISRGYVLLVSSIGIAASQLTTNVLPCAPDAAGSRTSQAGRGKKEGARGTTADAREARATTATARTVSRVTRPPAAFTRKASPRGTDRPAARQHAARVRKGRKSLPGAWRCA